MKLATKENEHKNLKNEAEDILHTEELSDVSVNIDDEELLCGEYDALVLGIDMC